MNRSSLIIATALLALSACTKKTAMKDYIVYFGTSGSEPGKGISIAHFSAETGDLTAPQLDVEVASPAYFVIHPDGRHLYAINEMDEWNGSPTGAVSAFSIEPGTGHLTLINQVSSQGRGPCYIALDQSGRYALVANYGAGSIAVIAINPDGSLGDSTGFDQHTGSSIDPDRQKKAYAHSVQADPTNQFVLSCDLGVDKLYIYRFNADNGSIEPNDSAFAKLPPGAGPRHFAFSPDGKFVYVINEMGSSVTTFAWDSIKGAGTELQTISTLPPDFEGENTCAEIRVHPSGKFLYGTNRGRDSIVLFAIDPASGTLTYVEDFPSMGKIPRNFVFDPTGKWLIVTNHGSDNGAIYAIDQDTGRLTLHGEPFSAPFPFCVKFLN